MKQFRSAAITLIVLSFLLTDSFAVASRTSGKRIKKLFPDIPSFDLVILWALKNMNQLYF